MTCPSCKSKTHELRYYNVDGKSVTQCKYCLEKHTPQARFALFSRAALGVNSQGKRTAAHDHDISIRKLASDGKTVYRDYGRKYI